MATKAPYKDLKKVYENIERMTVEGDEEVLETIDPQLQKAIIGQVNEEYDLSYKDTESKRATMLARLELYNNQRRDPSSVGDPLMFTVFNTVLASLYDDRLMVNFRGRGGEGDEDVEENLTALAEYDYDLMRKEELDYAWDWDAAFFGRGLMLMTDFDRKKGVMAPVPEVLDPTTWIRDPNATSVNGDQRGRGSIRFGGYETGATYYDLKELPGYFNLGALKKDKEIQSLLDKTQQARSDAQGRTKFSMAEETLGKFNNYEFRLINWFTSIQGQKYLITLGNRRSELVRLVKLDYDNRWPIEDRSLYPISHDWDGVCIPDLTEDKQRMRAILLNLGLISAKADAMPRYLYDKTRIKNKNDLNYRSNKYIGVDGRVDNAMTPVQKNSSAAYIAATMEILDQAAQRATATPEIQQGVQPTSARPLGETQIIAARSDTRYSMSAKIFGWSEKNFWKQWYRQYKKHFKDGIDEKVIRLQGPLAPTWRPLTRENIISEIDPDISVESRVMSDIKRAREQQSFDSFAIIAMQDPSNNRRYIQKKMAKLRGLRKDEIDMVFPPTVDEMQAEDENDLLNAEKLPNIGIMDDHKTHIYIHAKANQNAQSIAHIRAHKRLMLTKRDRPDIFPPEQAPAFQTQGSTAIPGQAATAATPSQAVPA
jgi:hypothetical protein